MGSVGQAAAKSVGWMIAVAVLVNPLLAQQAEKSQDLAERQIDFARDILPILSDNCFECHGPDQATRKGGFRLDQSESAFAEAESGEPPVVAGDSAHSEIIVRMLLDDESDQMPPPESIKRPTPEQIDLIRRWIDEGARWSKHWAYVPPTRPALPKVSDNSWSDHPVDQFVLARLESQGLQPSQPAGRTTLVRRLYLDLTGLPPTPEQVDDFLKDESTDAYDNLVNRLLDSPRYGEHMATFWLDAARFADTNGYQNDFRRSMWLWRDWVINAYNNNMPFDQFTIEQLAGDMLPNASLSQKIASGFNRNHRTNTEGGAIDEEWLVENVVDRVETTSTVFMGLTMGCARCHDHKYDPISQREFYQFFAYFNNVDEKGVYTETRGNAGPSVSVPTPGYHQRLKALRATLAERQAHLKEKVESGYRMWRGRERSITDILPPNVAGHEFAFLARGKRANPPGLQDVIDQLDASKRLGEKLPGTAVNFSGDAGQRVDVGPLFDFDATKEFTVTAWVWPTKNGAIISRMDANNAYRGFDMLIQPDGRLNVHLIHRWPVNATKVTSELAIPKQQWTHVAVSSSAPGNAKSIQIWINGQKVSHSVNNDTLDGTTQTDHPIWIGHRENTPPLAGKISDIRIWNEALTDDQISQIHNQTLQYMVVSTKEDRTEEQREALDRQYRFMASAKAQSKVSATEREIDRLTKQLPTTMVMKERSERRPTYVLKRGVYDQPDLEQPVFPAVPALFPAEASGESGPGDRLQLARWLVKEDHPLTARVAVNHFWARYFGRGLVDTPENFGVQSSPPTHPGLLDWLACEFVDSGWDIKSMQRLIVTSKTYRQSSAADQQSISVDPKNRWLSRGSRFRLSAETIRDNALAISGLLVDKLGGPSVKPYQPKGLWSDLAGGAGEPPYRVASGQDLYRRSLYTYRKRTVPHPTVATFDGTSREICAVARDRTNTPLQALALLNDTTYVEAALHLAIMAIDSGDDVESRVACAFRRATGRMPQSAEVEILVAARNKYQSHFDQRPADAQNFVNTGQSQPGKSRSDIDAVELAAWGMLCNVILNLDEVITRE